MIKRKNKKNEKDLLNPFTMKWNYMGN